MEPADIAAIRILATLYERISIEYHQSHGESPQGMSKERRALRHLDHAIKHLRYGFLHSKGRSYRFSGRPQDSTPLWR